MHLLPHLPSLKHLASWKVPRKAPRPESGLKLFSRVLEQPIDKKNLRKCFNSLLLDSIESFNVFVTKKKFFSKREKY